MQPFWSISSIPLFYLFCSFSFLFCPHAALLCVMYSPSSNMATRGSWGTLGSPEGHSLPPSALLCPGGLSLLARFPQPLPAVPLGRKNSVSELFSHLSPTCSLWSFLFQCTISSSLCQHCHRRQKKTCSLHCRLLLLVSAL